MKQIKPLFLTFISLFILCLVLVYGKSYIRKKKVINPEDTVGGIEKVIENYGNAIDSAAIVFNIDPAYLKALCMLECSGRKAFEQRYEPHVYRKLKSVKFNIIDHYEHVTPEMLKDANDEALKNLASSWGPFQLMGYKCLQLGIKVRDIRGDQAVFYGTKWIEMTYGDYLKNHRYADAFHIHNTGMSVPSDGKHRTYDPKYVEHGLSYMKRFK